LHSKGSAARASWDCSLAQLVEAALRRGWEEDAAERLAEREEDERERLRRWLERSRRRPP